MTAVDLDALDRLRGAAAEWMREHLFWGLDPAKAPEAAASVLALPEFTDLIAEARKYRALREAVEGLLTKGSVVAFQNGQQYIRVTLVRAVIATVDSP